MQEKAAGGLQLQLILMTKFANLLIYAMQSVEGVDACCQRWFYSGKLLGDKVPIDECSIHQGYVVQVIVNTEHYNHDNSTSIVHMSLAS